VTVDNGNIPRRCIISFSSEATNNAEGLGVDVTYAISSQGGTCQGGIGPESFHAGKDSGGFFFSETHTSITVRILDPGMHTIEPCFRLNNPGGLGGAPEAILGRRCLVVECRTR